MSGRSFLIILSSLILAGSTWLVLREESSPVLSSEKRSRANADLSLSDPTNADSSTSAISVPVKDLLDFEVGRYYLIAFSARIHVAPELEKRQRLIAKYNTRTKPASGWAIALRRLPSSMRLEVYLQDQTEKGGWFSLAPVTDKQGHFHDYIVIISPGSFVSAYEVLEEGQGSRINKLGFIPIDDLGPIISEGNLQITSGNPKNDVFEGNIQGVGIFQVGKLLDEKQIIELLSNKRDTFLNEIKAKCIISFSEKYSDCQMKN